MTSAASHRPRLSGNKHVTQYLPPIEAVGPPPWSEPYRPPHTLIRWLTGLFLVGVFLTAILVLMSIAEALLYRDRTTENGIDNNALALGINACTVLLSVGVYIATTVLFCLWVYRANWNARALGADHMQFTPGWCIGWFFIPFMNLFKPFQAVREIYKASDPRSDGTMWRDVPTSALLGLWWFFWILTNVVGQIQMKTASSKDPDLLVMAIWMGVLSNVINITAALLALAVVRSIHARQEEKAQILAEAAVDEGVA